MEKGVLKMETDYSDSDFLIEWKKAVWLKTETHFTIHMEDGSKYYSTITSLNDTVARILSDSNTYITIKPQNIVFLNPFEDRFIERLSASIDIGLDIAKAENLRTLSTRSFLGYQTQKWSTDISYNGLRTIQDSTDLIRRQEGNLNFRLTLPKRWFAIATFSFLSNTEQKLDLRSNAQVGLGKFLIRNNRAYWGAKFGLNRNIERYSNETADRNSWEGFLGSELNLYDFNDFSLSSTIVVYPGITDLKRIRADGGLDLKYDLPHDFYIKISVSVNYDNRPADDASEFDYVLHTGFGWEL
jgi:hypothetical protein